MKLTVQMGTQKHSVDLPEQECAEKFKLMVGYLISARGGVLENGIGIAKPLPHANSDPEPIKPESKKELPPITKSPTVAAPQEWNPSQDAGYRGFMYMKCPECGEARGFNAKTPTREYRCSACGHTSEILGNLAKLFVNCECGKSFRYWTNIEDASLDIPCLDCGYPVAVQYNPNSHAYETIGREGRKKK